MKRKSRDIVGAPRSFVRPGVRVLMPGKLCAVMTRAQAERLKDSLKTHGSVHWYSELIDLDGTVVTTIEVSRVVEIENEADFLSGFRWQVLRNYFQEAIELRRETERGAARARMRPVLWCEEGSTRTEVLFPEHVVSVYFDGFAYVVRTNDGHPHRLPMEAGRRLMNSLGLEPSDVQRVENQPEAEKLTASTISTS